MFRVGRVVHRLPNDAQPHANRVDGPCHHCSKRNPRVKGPCHRCLNRAARLRNGETDRAARTKDLCRPFSKRKDRSRPYTSANRTVGTVGVIARTITVLQSDRDAVKAFFNYHIYVRICVIFMFFIRQVVKLGLPSICVVDCV